MEKRLFETKNHAEIYAKYRVVPPIELIARIVEYLKEKYSGPLDLALDVGCGSGQNSFLLAKYFKQVIASDVSENQVDFARKVAEKQGFDNVTFEVKPAEATSAEDNSVQLITAAEAFHWFDQVRFFNEARRVLCPGGVIALFGYITHRFNWERNPSKNEALITAHQQVFRGSLEDLWAPQNKDILFTKYDNVDLPFRDFVREVELVSRDRYWTLDDVIGDMKSWSAYQTYCNINGEKAGLRIVDDFKQKVLGILDEDLNEEEKRDPNSRIIFHTQTPFFLLLGRK